VRSAPKIFSLDPTWWELFLQAAILLAFSRLLLRRWPAARDWVFAATQLAVLLWVRAIDKKTLLGLVLPLLLAVFLLGKLLARHTGPARSRALLAVSIALPLTVLVVTKYSDASALFRGLTAWAVDLRPAPVIGLSYLAFKAVSFLVDVSSGKTTEPRLSSFLGYMLFFPTYLSGPIDRYGRFRRDLEAPPRLTWTEGLEAGWRIVIGYFKKTVMASAVAPFAISSFSVELAQASTGTLWLSLYAFAFLIYWDFSGYSDIAVGTGRLVGVMVPENFRSPYTKRNIIEFWNAWHITLSHWLRDYLFMPTGKALIKRWRRVPPLAVASTSYVITFALAGLWHGDGLNFLLWGAYMGLGLSACKAWGELTRRFPPGYHRFMFETRAGRALATVVTFHFLLAGWILFTNDLGRATRVVAGLVGMR